MNSMVNIDDYLKPADVHELNRQPIDGILSLVLVALMLFAVQCFNLYLLVWKDSSVLLAFVIHVFSVVAAAGFTGFRQKNGIDPRLALMLTITTATLGPFGPVGCIMALALQLFHTRVAQTFAEWFTSIFPRTHQSRPEVIHENILSGRDESYRPYSVIPFLDVMSVGSEDQKREALSKMTSMFHPSFALAFKRALGDNSNAIRVQAATAIAKIENAFLERLIKIQRVSRVHPNDAEVKLALAHHYDDYAYTGILDPERELTNREEALRLFTEYLHHTPNRLDIRLAIGRLLMRSERIQEAADWFRRCIEEGFVSEPLLMWYMESLYKLGEYHELRNVAHRFYAEIARQSAIPPRMLESLKLWAGDVALPGGMA